MKPSLSFVVLSLCFLSLALMAIAGDIPYWAWYIPVGVGIIATLTIFRGSYLPQNAVARGMELIKAQDYNNRLVKVGEPNADRIVSLFNSLIDKLRAERLLNREQESLLKLLIDASPMGVVMLDFNNNITMVNSAFLKISHCSGNDMPVGKNVMQIEGGIIRDMLKVPLGESEIIREGNFNIYRCYHLNFLQEGFKREFFLLESLTEEIMKAEKAAYEKVIRTISHEVNNSMGGVRSVLEITKDVIEDPEIKKVIESCDNRCEQMGNFIREYAEVVKIQAPVKKPFDLGREISIMQPFLQNMLSECISLRYMPPESKIIINGDSGQIQQVVLNIIKNAAESMPGTGEIEIKMEESVEGVNLKISNNGSPISAEVGKYLFTPFFTTKPRGKGIGLTFIREVLNRHNADYSLSTGEDGITTFNILFK